MTGKTNQILNEVKKQVEAGNIAKEFNNKLKKMQEKTFAKRKKLR